MKKTWKAILAEILGEKNQQKTTPPKPAPPVRDDPPVNYQDPRYLELAGQCAMGDIVAMMDLARWHRSHLRPGTEQLLADYEADSEARNALFKQIQCFYNDSFSCKAYMTWVFLAALYGNPEAEALIQQRPDFCSVGLLKPKTLRADRFGYELYYSSDLNRMGFLGVDSGLDEFNLACIRSEGIYCASYLSSYIPADSDGFGREDDYDDIFYDEFFNPLPGHKYSEAQAALPQLLAKREAYWNDPAHDREHRMYKRLVSALKPGEIPYL